MKEIENLKKAILEDYPRLDENSEFSFKCHKDVPCFNDCCGDVNIFLTPYDVIRLKNRLGITSGEFLSKYTSSPFDENSKYPIILFKMQDNEKKSCHFVSENGCTVYEDRPWPCRMYPLGLASSKESQYNAENEFYFLLKENTCKGHNSDNKITVKEWLENQGIEEYNRYGQWFKDITLHEFFEKNGILDPKKMEMFFTACYNIDKFRSFVFNSTFLQKFEIDEETQKKIKDDDIEMMRFAFNWIRFAIFGEKTMIIKTDAFAAAKEDQADLELAIVHPGKWIAAFKGFTKEEIAITEKTDWKFDGINPPASEVSFHIIRMFAEGKSKKEVVDVLTNNNLEKDNALALIRVIEMKLK